MTDGLGRCKRLAKGLAAVLCMGAVAAWADGLVPADAERVPIANGSFDQGWENGLPRGWKAYKMASESRRREPVPAAAGTALRLVDDDPAEEIGVVQTFPLAPGRFYELEVRTRVEDGGNADGIYAQLRFLPSERLAQAPLEVGEGGQVGRVWVGDQAPADTTEGVIYLYSSRPDRPRVVIEEAILRVIDFQDFAAVTAPKRLVLETPLVRGGVAEMRLVVPSAAPWAGLGQGLAAALKERLGVAVPVQSADAVTQADLAAGTAILLGHIGNNRAMLYPYSHSLCFSDGLYPGAGGFELRTVHDPWGNGRNLVVLGASDLAGQEGAIAAFLESLPAAAADVVLPPLFRVQHSEVVARSLRNIVTRTLDDAWQKAQEADTEKQLLQGIHCGLFTLAHRAGQAYALSQRPEYAREFVRLIRRAQSHHDSKPTTYGGPWGMDSDFMIHRVIPAWDALEECPAVSDADRLEVSQILHRWVGDLIHKGRPQGKQVRFNHTTFPALGGLYAGQYFERYYNDAQAMQWLRQAHTVFRFQADTTKPHCDCNSYQWLTVQHTMLYALASGDLTFFENGNIRRLADYLLLSQNPRGDGVAYGDIGLWRSGRAGDSLLRGIYWYRQDPAVAWLLGNGQPGDLRPIVGGYGLPLGEQAPPPAWLGLASWPLDEAWHRSFAGVREMPLERTFDKIAWRSGYDARDAYLLLDGLGTGGHGHMDGNAILQWCEDDRIWLADGDYIKSLPKYHNTLLVLRDGQSTRPPNAAELLHAADLPGTGFSQTALRGYAGVDWERSVVWLKGRWFAVIDRVTAKEDGDYSLRAVWQTVGTTRHQGSGLDVEQGGRHARIAFAPGTPTLVHSDAALGSNWRSYPHAGDGTVRVLQGIVGGAMKAGERRELATILDASGDVPSEAVIEALGDGLYRVRDAAGATLVALADDGGVCRLGADTALPAAALVVTPERLAAFAADLPGQTGAVDVEQDRAQGAAQGRAPAATRAGDQAPLRPVALPGPILTADTIQPLWTAPARPIAVADPAAAQAGGPGLALRWSQIDRPTSLLFSNNRGWPGHMDAGMSLSADPAPLSANVFSGEVGQNLLESLADGELQGTGAATMWDTDQVVTLDLSFTEAVRVNEVEIHVWHAAGSSKGKAYGIAAIDLHAGVPAAGAAPLARLGDVPEHSDWGTPVRHVFSTLDCETRALRLVLTPRPGRGVYIAEVAVRGAADGLASQAKGLVGGRFTAVALTDVTGDGQVEALAGSTSGRVLGLDLDGNTLWDADFASPVRALAGVAFDGPAAPGAVVVGGDSDTVRAFAGRDGAALWTHTIDRYKTAGDVGVMVTADLDGQGRQVAVAGSRNWRYHVLDRDGTKRWHYESVHLSTAAAAADLDADGRQELLLGTAYYGWFAVKSDGSTLWRYSTRGGPGCNVVAAGDVTGDGIPEVFFGGQDALVQAASAKGDVLWQFNTGDEVSGLAIVDGDGDGQADVVASSLSFNLFAIAGDGRRLWRRDLGSPLRGLALCEHAGRTVLAVATEAGRVCLVDPRQGDVLASHDLGAPVLRIATHGRLILAADDAGKLALLEAAPAP